MPRKSEKANKDLKRFELPASGTVNEVEYIFASVNALEVADGESLIINPSSIEVITTPVIQLLISLRKKIESAGGKLIFEEPSKQFTEAFESLGLKSQLT